MWRCEYGFVLILIPVDGFQQRGNLCYNSLTPCMAGGTVQTILKDQLALLPEKISLKTDGIFSQIQIY